MQRRSLAWFAVVGLGLAVHIGCATGEDPGVDIDDLQSAEVDAGKQDTGPTIALPSPPSNEDAGTTDPDPIDEDGGVVDGGSEGGVTVDSGTPDGGTGGTGTVSCASPNTCVAATDLGSVSGDEGSGLKTASGSGSQWFKIRVTEDDSSVFGTSMQLRTVLVSPAGTNFDLYVYRAGGSSGQECSAVTKSSTLATGTDVASMEWGESGAFSNGSDDDRTVSVEVRWVSGTCTAGAKWTLTVQGNAL